MILATEKETVMMKLILSRPCIFSARLYSCLLGLLIIPVAYGASSAEAVQDGLVPETLMQDVYEEVKAPFKYGVVLKHPQGLSVDCPTVFRQNDRWYMLYIIFDHKKGYETWLASSDDLLRWKTEDAYCLTVPEASGPMSVCRLCSAARYLLGWYPRDRMLR